MCARGGRPSSQRRIQIRCIRSTLIANHRYTRPRQSLLFQARRQTGNDVLLAEIVQRFVGFRREWHGMRVRRIDSVDGFTRLERGALRRDRRERNERWTMSFIVEDLNSIFVHLSLLLGRVVAMMIVVQMRIDRCSALLLLLLHMETKFQLRGFLNQILRD